MSAQDYRVMVVAANIILVLGVFVLGYRIYAGPGLDPREQPPADFDPLRFAVEDDGARIGSLDEHQVTWRQLDRPKPPPPPPPPRDEGPVVTERPPINENSYSLVMASFDPKNPDKSTVILEHVQQRGTTVTVTQGGEFDGYQVLEIAIHGEGDQRKAIVTLTSRGARRTIELKRQ